MYAYHTAEFMGPLGYEKIHSALSSMEDLAHENGFEEKSSVNQFPINTESDFGDEVSNYSCIYTKLGAG